MVGDELKWRTSYDSCTKGEPPFHTTAGDAIRYSLRERRSLALCSVPPVPWRGYAGRYRRVSYYHLANPAE